MVNFNMFNNNGQTNFSSIKEEIPGGFSFLDYDKESIVEVLIFKKGVCIKKKGKVVMKQVFCLGKKMIGKCIIEGIIIDISSYTKELEVTQNSLKIIYDYFVDNIFQNENVLKIEW